RAKLLFDAVHDVFDGDWIDVVLQLLELLDVRRRQEIRPGGQDLSELDVRRSELDEAFAKRARCVGRSAKILARFRLVSDALQSLLFREVSEAVAGEQPDGGRESREIARGEDH